MFKREFKIYRGDPKELTIVLTGDYSAKKLIFVVKEDKVVTSDRLIQKKNVAAGGSDAQMTASYASGKTTITVFLDKDDTQDFDEEEYYYDLTAQPADESEEPETIAAGNLKIEFDVQTDFDGTNLPSSATRYVNLDASEAEAGDLIQCQLVDGVKTFVLITIEDLKTQLGIE